MNSDKYKFDFNKNDVIQRIKEVRKDLKLTQTEMGKKMGLSLRQYYLFENIKGLPVSNRFINFAYHTKINIDWLFNGNPPKWSKDKKTNMIVRESIKKYNDDDIKLDLEEINSILKCDKSLRKRILNFLRMHKNLSKFD